MILHYVTLAIRNLLKYRTQNIISIIGLAVGLFSFCVCLYCSRFIQSTNHCFDNYKRIVLVSPFHTVRQPLFRQLQADYTD